MGDGRRAQLDDENFHVFLNMDKMLGKLFEEGLGNLKELTEK